MKTPNEKIILEAIKNKLDEGYIIYAEWDAGGDETPCYVKYISEDQSKKWEWKYEHKGFDISNELRNLIIDKLDLPNAGDVYNKGFGYITINQENQLILSYTAKHYFTEDAEYKNFNQKLIDLPVEYNLGSYVHRAIIQFEATLDEEGNFDFSITIRVREGDDISLSKDCHIWYQSFFRKKLSVYESQFEQLIKSGNGIFISIDANLNQDNELRGNLHEDYRKMYYNRKNHQQILL